MNSFINRALAFFNARRDKKEPKYEKVWRDGKASIESRTLADGTVQARAARHPETLIDDEFYWSPNITGEIKLLKKEKRYLEAETKLKSIVAAAIKDAELSGSGVAPWAFEQLAILYRKQKRVEDEVKILKTFSKLPHSPGAKPKKLIERLKKAKRIAKSK